MHLWYLLLTAILCSVFSCEAQKKGSAAKFPKQSLLKFFTLNNDFVASGESKESEHISGNVKSNISEKIVPSLNSTPLTCEQHSTGTPGKKLCTKKHKSNAVKKSFRPHDYDDDEDCDDPRSDDDESPDDEELPEEDMAGLDRAFEDSPPRPRDPESLDESEDDRETRRRPEFEDDPRDMPGYEDDLDGEREGPDWEPPRRHHGRPTWRSHHHPEDDDDDEYEPNYYPRFHHHPRHAHYHHHQYGHPAVQANYRTFNQAAPSWMPYPQGFQSVSSAPSPIPYGYYPAGWTRSPAGQTSWQSPYLFTAATHSFNAIGPRVINPYLQNTFTYPQRETNSFFIPQSSRHVSSPPYLEATARNVVSFSNTLPGIVSTLPRLSHDIFQYTRFNPRVVSRMRHFGGQLPRHFLRHSVFPDAVLNRIRESNLH